MAHETHLDIVSAEKQIYSGQATMVVATGEMGEIGIVPGHAPLLSVLKPGEVRMTKQDGSEEIFYVSGGMIEVQPYQVTILADVVVRAEELSEEAAMAAKAKAEELLSKHQSDIDYSAATAELAHAIAQIRAIQKLRHKHH
jgi:F-type H+-transporting ATPase subunit epsilon